MARNTWTASTPCWPQMTPRDGWALTREAAKYIANAMAYDDVIRVADLKTRGRRFDRIRRKCG